MVDSGGFKAQAEQKRIMCSDELETPRRPRNYTVVVIANGEVQTNEENRFMFTILASS